jgi:transposase
VVRKILNRGAETIQEICEQEGVLKGTATTWLSIGATPVGMAKGTTRRKWTGEEQLRIVTETHALGGEALGTYLREHGLHSHLVEEWRSEIVRFLSGASKSSEKDPRDEHIRDLEREVTRKDKALAEASALLILQKKVDLIWGRKDEGKK